jgi:hypothetical protein
MPTYQQAKRAQPRSKQPVLDLVADDPDEEYGGPPDSD